MNIVGIVGQQGSGKDTAALYLAKHYGLLHISTSDQIREYIRKNNLGETTRDVIQATITKLRAEHGPAVIVDQIFAEYPNSDLILSGLRHPAEAELIMQHGGFVIAIQAPQKDRYKRSLGRNRVGDSISFREFSELEKAENGANAQTYNINSVIAIASDKVLNQGSFKQLYAALDQVMKRHNIAKVS